MKILTATGRTQGQRASDYDWCIEGELVTCATVICDRDRAEGPDGGCGCGRAFSGLNSHKATTTAMVRDLDGYTFEDLLEAVRSCREQSGWNDGGELAKAEAVALAELAAEHPAGTILERRLDDALVRATAADGA